MKRNMFFIFLSMLALVFYSLKQTDVHITFISNYGNDILYIPIICWLSEKTMRLTYPAFEITYLHVLANVLIACIAFEWIIPAYNLNYTADILDAGCYITGGAAYTLFFIPKKTNAGLGDYQPVP